MNANKVAVLVLVYVLACIGWVVLGGSVTYRQYAADDSLRPQVESLWGQPLTQIAPSFELAPVAVAGVREAAAPRRVEAEASDVDVRLDHEFRRKGLLRYRTYTADFAATYTVRNDTDAEADLRACVALPAPKQTYDNFAFRVKDGDSATSPDKAGGWRCSRRLGPGEYAQVTLRYGTRGLDRFSYRFAEQTACVRNLRFAVRTNFRDFDLPSTSPTTKTPTDDGWLLEWKYDSLLSGVELAVDTPTRLQPGPLASRISYFAPVGLLFFLTVMVLIGVVHERNLHPMHYLFVCGAFFAFHLLFTYLVDLISINSAFVASAAVSVLLVATYVVRFMGARFTFAAVVPAQALFLILFSYAFFFRGYTGLTITIASIVTLAVLMQLTARIDWDAKFGACRAAVPKPQ